MDERLDQRLELKRGSNPTFHIFRDVILVNYYGADFDLTTVRSRPWLRWEDASPSPNFDNSVRLRKISFESALRKERYNWTPDDEFPSKPQDTKRPRLSLFLQGRDGKGGDNEETHISVAREIANVARQLSATWERFRLIEVCRYDVYQVDSAPKPDWSDRIEMNGSHIREAQDGTSEPPGVQQEPGTPTREKRTRSDLESFPEPCTPQKVII
jgi:hypothetical protein